MPDEKRMILTAADVTEDVIGAAVETFNGWFDDDEPIDWEDFFARMERHHPFDFGDQMDTPAMRKVQRTIRAYRRGEEV
jgi:hypothetical protein